MDCAYWSRPTCQGHGCHCFYSFYFFVAHQLWVSLMKPHLLILPNLQSLNNEYSVLHRYQLLDIERLGILNLMYIYVHSCTPMYTLVHQCTPMYTHVHPCTLMKHSCTILWMYTQYMSYLLTLHVYTKQWNVHHVH